MPQRFARVAHSVVARWSGFAGSPASLAAGAIHSAPIDRPFGGGAQLLAVFFAVAARPFPCRSPYATIWHDVLASPTSHDIAAFPPCLGARSGREQLGDARLAYWVIWAIELAALPVLVRVTRRILDADAGGGLPSAADGWRGALAGSGRGLVRALARPGPLIVGAALAATVFYLSRAIGGLLVEPLPTSARRRRGLVDASQGGRSSVIPVVAAVAAGGGGSHQRAPAPCGRRISLLAISVTKSPLTGPQAGVRGRPP